MGRNVKYTRELLAEAAAATHSVAGVLRYLGVPTGGSLHSHIRRRLNHYGIDTSHFTGSSVYSLEALEKAVAESSSVAGVLRSLGLVEAGGTHRHISMKIRELGLDTSHFRRYQAPAIQARRLSPAEVLVLDPGLTKRRLPRLLRRALLESGRPYRCEGCGCEGEWNGMPIRLQVDHINADFRDNRESNLRFLCPNCHSQTPSWAGKNKGHYSKQA